VVAGSNFTVAPCRFRKSGNALDLGHGGRGHKESFTSRAFLHKTLEKRATTDIFS
jgi:hypothetical protein